MSKPPADPDSTTASTYGTFALTPNLDGTFEVDHADRLVGISIELLINGAQSGLVTVDQDNITIIIGGQLRYRPVKWEPCALICVRVA